MKFLYSMSPQAIFELAGSQQRLKLGGRMICWYLAPSNEFLAAYPIWLTDAISVYIIILSEIKVTEQIIKTTSNEGTAENS